MADTSFLGSGWTFPLALDEEKGTLKQASEEEAVRRSIELILGTPRGARVMRPDFGSELSSFLFRPITATNRIRIANTAKEALVRWEPRIKVLDIQVEVDMKNPVMLVINIDYQIRTTSTRSNLVYPFYVGGVES